MVYKWPHGGPMMHRSSSWGETKPNRTGGHHLVTIKHWGLTIKKGGGSKWLQHPEMDILYICTNR